jgi:hypothetical protein
VVRALDDEGAAMIDMRRRVFVVLGSILLAVLASAHVGSPDVFFTGKAGSYAVRVVVRPPEVVPGIARVTVRTREDVKRVSIRPVYWRAGSRGAPSADDTRRLAGESRTFEGSLWLMARGAYSVDVIVDGPRGPANVLVPVASVATGRLAMHPALGVLLAALGVLLFAGLVNIVQKGAGESLLGPRDELDSTQRRRARRVGAIAVPILAVAVFGGARWWSAVDAAYERTLHRPSPLAISLSDGILSLRTSDSVWQPARQGRRPSAIVPDHGKLMHLFLVRDADASAFAHLHPLPTDSSEIPAFRTSLPPLPSGTYHVYGDVVHETGFERTLVGSITLAFSSGRRIIADADDAWHVGAPTRANAVVLADGSTMQLEMIPDGALVPGREKTIRISVKDPRGRPANLDLYLGMPAHGVVVRADGAVYVHLHPMGTITSAAQQVFLARDRGDTTDAGRLRLDPHAGHGRADVAIVDSTNVVVEFPYAFPTSGSYHLFVQVKREGRILTGAFALTVADTTGATR